MSVKVVFEIGHIASLKNKTTPEGFTHDWELYVRGCDNADISHYVEKVVFNLHESFPKPKRVFKEPPYSLKESGYAGFVLPIDIYFKNRDDPKRITCSYDLNLQNTGTITNVEKKIQLFKNPSEDFRRKLLKGGGFVVNNFANNSDDKGREQDERAQLISKPKLGGSELSGKKYKSKDESKVSNTYANLFGSSGSKGTAKVSPDTKAKSSSNTGAKQPQKTEKISRDKVEKKEKNKHNSPNKEKIDGRDVAKKTHEDKHEKREEKKKDKTHSKERDRSKDKVSIVKQDPSPKCMPQSRGSPSRSTSALSKTDESQPSVAKGFPKQVEQSDRPSSSAKKIKKDKKDKNSEKERDRERVKDQLKPKDERPSSKVSDKIDLKKETVNRNQKDKAKVNDLKQAITIEHPIEAPAKAVTPNENQKKSEKDPDRTKHKHKKKDKNKDKEKDNSKERKKEKSSKYKEDVKMVNLSPAKKLEQSQSSQLPQLQTKVNPLTTLLNEIEEKPSSDSDDDHSKPSISYHQSVPAKLTENAPKPVEEPQLPKPEKLPDKVEKPAKRGKKEKEPKSTDKEDKKRKRKSKDENEFKQKTPSPAFSEPPLKQSKKDDNGALSWRGDIASNFMSTIQNTPPPQRIDSLSRSSPLPPIQKTTPSRSSVRATPSPLPTSTTHHQSSPNLQQQQRQQKDYMSQLRELQHKIMTLEDNNELQQVVEMIAETGCYEITSKTFDFDLCALDRTTVQRLQTFFATSSTCWL